MLSKRRPGDRSAPFRGSLGFLGHLAGDGAASDERLTPLVRLSLLREDDPRANDLRPCLVEVGHRLPHGRICLLQLGPVLIVLEAAKKRAFPNKVAMIGAEFNQCTGRFKAELRQDLCLTA
jgi:hypothetical protein